MEAAINTFTGGMDLDTDVSILPSNRYRKAVNYRLTTSKAGTSGALETVLGTETISVLSGVVGTIIGYCWMRSTLVVFSTGYSGGNLYNSIYAIGFSSDLTIVGPPRLVYSNASLAFSTLAPITAVARYENANTQKVYWTDGINPVRFINVSPFVNSTGLSLDKLEFLPSTLANKGTSKHRITATECTGGFYTSGKIQYAVQLTTTVGTESPIYIDPTFYHVAIGTENYALDKAYHGGYFDEKVNKGFNVVVSNIPSGFDKLRLIAIKYSIYNSEPTINIVKEANITNSTSVSVLDLGDSSIGEYSLEELSVLSSKIFKANDIETKNDILFTSNISSDTWDVSYDARAYRFAGLDNTGPGRVGKAGIWQENGQFFEVSTNYKLVYNNQPVPETYDCINLYNDRSYEFNSVNDTRYKYRQGLAYLGGSGPNVSYKFNLKAVPIANIGNNSTVAVGNSTDGPTSAINSYKSAGYQRGEIYRFGVVLHNNRGQDSSVKWIGDIRFPDITDAYSGDTVYVGATNVTPATYDVAFITNNTIHALVLIPVFTFTNIPADVVGITIVRANRDTSNRTVICSGLFGGLLYNGNYCFPPPKIADMKDTTYNKFYFDDQASSTYDVSYDPRGLSNYYFEFISPEININRNITYGSYLTDFIIYGGYSFQNYNKVATSNESYYSVLAASLGGGYNPPDPFCTTFLHTNTKASISMNRPLFNAVADFKIAGKCPVNNVNPISSTGGIEISNLLYVNKIDAGNRSYHGTTGVFATTTAVIPPVSQLQHPMYGSYIRLNANIYGRSYSSRLLTDYYACTPILDPNITVECYGGDTYITMFDYLRTYIDLEYKASQFSNLSFPVESTINTALRSDKAYKRAFGEKNAFLMQENAGVHTPTWDTNLSYAQESDLYTYNTVYSQQNISKVYHERDYTKATVTSYDCRILYSDIKTNGEQIDSWTKFRVNNYKDVDATYGSLNALRTFNNQLYFWQTNAFGALAVNQRELIPSSVTSTAPLVLGVGGILDRYDYISYEIGSVDKMNIVRNNNGMYWFDLNKKLLIRYNSTIELLSKTKSVNSYFMDTVSNPVLAYDPLFNEILISKQGSGESIVFSEQLDLFTGFYNFAPAMAFNNTTTLLTKSNTNNYLHLHRNNGLVGCFYGNTTPYCTLKIVVNDKYQLPKVFDSIEYETESTLYDSSTTNYESTTFTDARFYNTYQNTGYVDIVYKTNLRRRERGFTMFIPRNALTYTSGIDILNPAYINTSRTFKERMRDKYLVMDLDYYGSDNSYKLKVPYIVTKYRISER